MQSGGVDCALYSMAIHHLALGCDLTELVYNQPDLWPHLIRCLESSTLTPFLTLKQKTFNRVSIECLGLRNACYCRMPVITPRWYSVITVMNGTIATVWLIISKVKAGFAQNVLQ